MKPSAQRKHPPIVVLTGASGAGKSSVLDRLLAEKRLPIAKFVTCTTRAPRQGEKHGKDYWFLTQSEFKKRIKEQDMYEWAEVYGQYYGSSKTDLKRMLRGKKAIVLVIDVQGTKTIKKQHPDAVTIFIDAATRSLKQRLIGRGADLNDLKRRLAEISQEKRYRRSADVVITNTDGHLEEAAQKVAKTIQAAFRANA